jgi:hypothetical protein
MHTSIRPEKVVTTLQRPIIFVLMVIACPALFGLGCWANYGLGLPLVTGNLPIREDANKLGAYGLIAAICVMPLLLSWISARLAKKAWVQMKTSGVTYE